MRYPFFKQAYWQNLIHGPYMDPLLMLASAETRGAFTLLHQCEDRQFNSAAALRELLNELGACSASERLDGPAFEELP
jgi:uncharacterized protein YeaO (DUF488 family)